MVAAESRIGLCIAGCGSIAKAHAEVARRRDARIRLYFASRSQAKAVRYANRYGAEGAFGSYEAAAKDPRVDAILFCTPHSLHRPNLELAATHKKHVLMEKPIATTIEDADAMTDTALKAGIHLMVAEKLSVHASREGMRRPHISRDDRVTAIRAPPGHQISEIQGLAA